MTSGPARPLNRQDITGDRIDKYPLYRAPNFITNQVVSIVKEPLPIQ